MLKNQHTVTPRGIYSAEKKNKFDNSFFRQIRFRNLLLMQLTNTDNNHVLKNTYVYTYTMTINVIELTIII